MYLPNQVYEPVPASGLPLGSRCRTHTDDSCRFSHSDDHIYEYVSLPTDSKMWPQDRNGVSHSKAGRQEGGEGGEEKARGGGSVGGGGDGGKRESNGWKRNEYI